MTLPAELVIAGPRPLHGRLRLPGCKGISHRALLFAACADGVSRITGLAGGDDVQRTRSALESLGVSISDDGETVVVEAHGVNALHAPSGDIDCGNSGTTLRTVTGLVAARPFTTVLTGDASLVERPMRRVVAPLRAMGAHIEGRDDGDRAPLSIRGADLRGTRVDLEVASGQVKTALVLAGLQAAGDTEIREPAPSRDHTERMLVALDAPVERVDERTVRVKPGAPRAFELDVPGDASSAAFFVVAALVTPGSRIVLEHQALNPARIEYIDVLRRMGADIAVRVIEERLGEPVGEIEVVAGALHATTIDATESIIDEVPALAVAAAFADGVTEFRQVAELRVKESDRIATLEQELGQLNIGVEAKADGLTVRGGRPRPGTLKSHGDHRIALAAAIAANALEGESTVRGWRAVAASYPEFAAHLAALTGASA
jgi:3-phosphoshikimate 1-carboxyvinyltransferase